MALGTLDPERLAWIEEDLDKILSMIGTGEYPHVRWPKLRDQMEGFISVDAVELIAEVRRLQAERHGVWGEGYGAGWNDCLLDLQNGGAKMTDNPYTEEG